ncbi:MAG: hypothetical protein IH859_04345 [Chloroflexi bacterium]|nr:hypothetical protein [Chloroflexota bacterium]
MLSQETQFKLEAMMADFEVRGAAAIKELREENLAEYMNMISDLALAELDSTNQ